MRVVRIDSSTSSCAAPVSPWAAWASDRCDVGLLECVVANVIDNALQHGLLDAPATGRCGR
jgi:hypothetical protein